jgi:hypothetical protein
MRSVIRMYTNVKNMCNFVNSAIYISSRGVWFSFKECCTAIAELAFICAYAERVRTYSMACHDLGHGTRSSTRDADTEKFTCAHKSEST